MAEARVMVTAAGGIVSQGIIKSLKLANSASKAPVHYFMMATDASPLAAGLYRCNAGELVPPARSDAYVDSIIDICKKNGIEAIFVGSDDELLVLAEAKERIESESGAIVIVGPIGQLSIARDKWKTYEFCIKKGITCAPTALPEDAETFVKEFGFPMIIKPREGYGSVQLHLVNSRDELENALHLIQKANWNPILQKYIPGDEFTSGVTLDRGGKYVLSSISIRKILKQGQTHKAFIGDFPTVRRPAEEAALKLGIAGPANIQVRMDGGDPSLIEINPRFSATCPMRAVAGVNEPDIVFRNSVRGEEVKVDRYESFVCLRYLNEVYVPEQAYNEMSANHKIKGDSSGSFIPPYF